MSTALRIHQGRFGRVKLLDMDKPLIVHAHPHCHVLIKAEGADTFFSVAERFYPLLENTAVLVNAWQPHSYAHSAASPRTVILALYIEPRWLARAERDLAASASPGFFRSPCVEINPRVRELADQLAFLMLYGVGSEKEHETLLFELMVTVIDLFSEWRSLRGALRAVERLPIDFRVRRAIEFLRGNMGEDFDMATLAREAGLSRAHLFRLFQEATHLTPNVYQNVLRMEAAIHELTRSPRSLAEISGALGFSAQSHFTRFFRNHLGITPSEYRQVVQLGGLPPLSPI